MISCHPHSSSLCFYSTLWKRSFFENQSSHLRTSLHYYHRRVRFFRGKYGFSCGGRHVVVPVPRWVVVRSARGSFPLTSVVSLFFRAVLRFPELWSSAAAVSFPFPSRGKNRTRPLNRIMEKRYYRQERRGIPNSGIVCLGAAILHRRRRTGRSCWIAADHRVIVGWNDAARDCAAAAACWEENTDGTIPNNHRGSSCEDCGAQNPPVVPRVDNQSRRDRVDPTLWQRCPQQHHQLTASSFESLASSAASPRSIIGTIRMNSSAAKKKKRRTTAPKRSIVFSRPIRRRIRDEKDVPTVCLPRSAYYGPSLADPRRSSGPSRRRRSVRISRRRPSRTQTTPLVIAEGFVVFPCGRVSAASTSRRVNTSGRGEGVALPPPSKIGTTMHPTICECEQLWCDRRTLSDDQKNVVTYSALRIQENVRDCSNILSLQRASRRATPFFR